MLKEKDSRPTGTNYAMNKKLFSDKQSSDYTNSHIANYKSALYVQQLTKDIKTAKSSENKRFIAAQNILIGAPV